MANNPYEKIINLPKMGIPEDLASRLQQDHLFARALRSVAILEATFVRLLVAAISPDEERGMVIAAGESFSWIAGKLQALSVGVEDDNLRELLTIGISGARELMADRNKLAHGLLGADQNIVGFKRAGGSIRIYNESMPVEKLAALGSAALELSATLERIAPGLRDAGLVFFDPFNT